METILSHAFHCPSLAPEEVGAPCAEERPEWRLDVRGTLEEDELIPGKPLANHRKRGRSGGRKTLTDRLVTAARPAPAGTRVSHLDAVVPGLVLRVTNSGAKTWSLVKWVDGRALRVGIGSYPGVGLAAARGIAREKLEAIARGEDPRRTKAARERTFNAVADLFLAESDYEEDTDLPRDGSHHRA
jgi:Arm DNA-binding domain